MKAKMRIVFFCFLLLCRVWTGAFAQPILDIFGVIVPLPYGAAFRQKERIASDTSTVMTYAVDASVTKIVEFYESFFKDNGFIIIGGRQGDGFEASVKKDDAMFAVKIFAQGAVTIIQFIW